MNGNVDLIVVKTKKGEYAGWGELYKGVIVKDPKTNKKFVYAVERCDPLNRYYRIALSDLETGETNDTLYIKVEKENWGDTSKGAQKFTDKRIESVMFGEGLPKDSSVWHKLLAMAATIRPTK